MNPDNFNMSEQELNAQRRRRAENFKLNIDESEYEDDNFVKSEDEPSNLNSYSGQDVKKQMARESKQVLKQKKKEEKKALKAKNKYNRRTFRFIWVISVLIVGAMAAVYMITGMNDLLAVNRTDSSTVKIEIPENPTVDDVTKVLVDNKVIGEPSYFKLFVNVTKSADDFTQGTYEIRRNMDYEAIINFLSSNNNRTDTVSVTITEGESVLEIANTLEKNGALGDRDEFLSLCNSEKFDSDFDFIKAETNADKRYYKLEGYLYPDTYEFYRNENAESVIYKFLNNYETKRICTTFLQSSTTVLQPTAVSACQASVLIQQSSIRTEVLRMFPKMTEAPTRADMIHMTGRDFLTVLSAIPVWMR